MIRKLVLFIGALTIGAGVLAACHGGGANYYFSTSGSDANNCTSTSTPCKTLSKTGGRLAGITLFPGDHVFLHTGDTWTGDFVKINQSGTSLDYISVNSYGTGVEPKIQDAAGSPGSSSNCVEVIGNYVSIRSLNLNACGSDPTDLYFAGITITGDNAEAASLIVKNNHVGIKTKHGANNAVIRNNTLIDNNLWQKTPSVNCTNQAQGMDLEGNDAQVDSNNISGSITTTACDGSQHGSAVEVFGGSRNIITRNTVSSSKSFSELGKDAGNGLPADDNVYAWNVVFNNDASHTGINAMRGIITRGDGDTTYGPVKNTVVKDNTFSFRSTATSGVDLQGIVCGGGCSDGSTTVLTAKNNVINIDAPSGSGVMKAIFSNNANSNYNLYRCTNSTLSECVNGSMTLGASDRTGCTSGSCGGYVPGFVDPTAVPPNLHLISTSSNCNSGTNSYDNQDHDYQTVPQNGVVDRGAYEDC